MIVRAAVASDAAGVARVHARSWQVAYRGLVPDAYLDGLSDDTWRERWERGLATPGDPRTVTSVLLAADRADGELVGFARVGPTRDDDLAPQGLWELYAIYLAPSSWGLGGGRQLLRATLASVPDGVPATALWVLAGNGRGRQFYERHGYVADGAAKTIDLGGAALAEVRYRRPSASSTTMGR